MFLDAPIGAALVSSVLVELLTGVFAAGGEPGKDEESKRILRGYLVTGVWVGGFVAAIFLVGFLIAIPLFVFSYMRLHGSSWLGAILITIFILGFMYVISEPLAGIKLYRGIIPMYFSE